MHFINNAEMAGLVSEGFDLTEVTTVESGSTTVTTIYGGKCDRQDPSIGTQALDVWKIRRTIISEDGNTTKIEKTWAEGAWENRESLTYKYL